MSNEDRERRQARGGFCRRLRTLVLLVPVLTVTATGPASAQGLDDTRPDGSGMPGREFLVQLLEWGMYAGIAACIGAVVYGGATWMGFGSSSTHRAVSGKAYVVGGLIGAATIGLGPTAVQMVLDAANT